MLFHEIYGCYYQAVAKILAMAVDGHLTMQDMYGIIRETAFAESAMTIVPALENHQWPLLDEDMHTPLKNKPDMPLTTLELRWLKSIRLDPRFRLFCESPAEGRADAASVGAGDGGCLGAPADPDTSTDIWAIADQAEPLFTPEDFTIFDQYKDGDDFLDPVYIENFQTILKAIRQRKNLRLRFHNRSGRLYKLLCTPKKLEYSEKDDKFRLLAVRRQGNCTINVGRITACSVTDETFRMACHDEVKPKDYFVMHLTDERNALERLLLHFAHFQKEARRLSDKLYEVKIFYDIGDETELIIRVLSFGPLVRVTEPERFVRQMKNRLIMQKKLGIR